MANPERRGEGSISLISNNTNKNMKHRLTEQLPCICTSISQTYTYTCYIVYIMCLCVYTILPLLLKCFCKNHPLLLAWMRMDLSPSCAACPRLALIYVFLVLGY